MPPVAASGAASASAAAPRLPNVHPGPYHPATVTIPPPPPGLPPLAFPTVAGDVQAGEGATNIGVPASAASAPTAPVEKKPSIFFTQEQLQTQRAKCTVTLKSSPLVTAPNGESHQVLHLAVIGGRMCVKGVASSEEWLRVSDVSDDGSVVMAISANDTAHVRDAEVTIANTGTSIHITLTQQAGFPPPEPDQGDEP